MGLLAFVSLKPDEWTTLLAAINVAIVLVGTVLAVGTLVVISRTLKIQSLRDFLTDLEKTAPDREWIFQHAKELTSSNPVQDDARRRVENIINLLNRVSLLLDNKLLSVGMVLSISHTVILRCYHCIAGYVQAHEKKVGGRYGRRLDRLAKTARQFHDVHPMHRSTVIKIYHKEYADKRLIVHPGRESEPDQEQQTIIVYQTTRLQGWRGLRQRVQWFVRRHLHLYT